jgi:CheY-like chemotaxis protein
MAKRNNKKINILLVEDEGITLEYLEDAVLELGHSIAGKAYTGKQAIDIVEQKKVDLLIMDIRLKGKLNGIQTTKKIQEKYFIPVIYITAYEDNQTLHEAKQTYTYGYLVKPFKRRELQIVIDITLLKGMKKK